MWLWCVCRQRTSWERPRECLMSWMLVCRMNCQLYGTGESDYTHTGSVIAEHERCMGTTVCTVWLHVAMETWLFVFDAEWSHDTFLNNSLKVRCNNLPLCWSRGGLRYSHHFRLFRDSVKNILKTMGSAALTLCLSAAGSDSTSALTKVWRVWRQSFTVRFLWWGGEGVKKLFLHTLSCNY